MAPLSKYVIFGKSRQEQTAAAVRVSIPAHAHSPNYLEDASRVSNMSRYWGFARVAVLLSFQSLLLRGFRRRLLPPCKRACPASSDTPSAPVSESAVDNISSATPSRDVEREARFYGRVRDLEKDHKLRCALIEYDR
eukprot:28224-Chlamydomonas_euryale.AAC.14